MDTIFINSGNSKKTNDGSGKLVLDIFNTMDLSGAQRYVSLSNLSIFYTSCELFFHFHKTPPT